MTSPIRIDRHVSGYWAAIALFLLVWFLSPVPCACGAPLTPSGVAPQSYSGSTAPDSVQAYLISSDVLAHGPLGIAAALEGLETARRGDTEKACAIWEQAKAYDPTNIFATLASARFDAWQHPELALRAILAWPSVLVRGFTAQQTLAANLFILIFFPLLMASIALALLIFARHVPKMHHLIWEHLQPLLPRWIAKWAAWGLIVLPVVWDLGFILWAALLLTVAFPLLTRVERRLALILGGWLLIAPLAVILIAVLVAPADPSHPVAALYRAQQGGHNPQARAEIQLLEERYPDEAALYFTESFLARQANDLPAARRALKEAERSGSLSQARCDRTWGILAYREGNLTKAIHHLVSAVRKSPKSFNGRYNLAKSYARASLFLKADREMREAFGLNAARARLEEQRRLHAHADDLIEERLGSADLWKLLVNRHSSEGFQMPRFLAQMFPGGNPYLLWACIPLIPIMGMISRRWHRRLFIHTCCQCSKTVCRKCLKRRDRRIFCEECAVTARKWASAQYTQILLTKLLGRHDRVRDRVLDALRCLIPGLGAVLRRSPRSAYLQLLMAAWALLWLASSGLPVKGLLWSTLDDLLLPHVLIGVTILLLLQAWVVSAEVRSLQKRTNLKEFLGASRSKSKRPRIA